ncbi:hypothetical protein PF005_g20743 [Phytophthora fragariae]|uniref:Uncharacterized protein n=1 Tax=Phytophthora fragariae TaxID=53985 RepID=A0A6A3QZV8_9STRA|nr:hypothetical protein PF003_g3191 [Phytophthora fragariae]KAE8927697.1 hypothetical protein PF009_g22140 [Phytophthora fragariae]KAE8987598.1 hypothetical protein PF011_g19513 [Phytophthora fragariae]KAE9085989.1 hypothetical protein PF010_g20261 [Phytophthora fragariae]KAE9086268.1 hypothetical protein PF007_g20843 [Phytophthora fragariae]
MQLHIPLSVCRRTDGKKYDGAGEFRRCPPPPPKEELARWLLAWMIVAPATESEEEGSGGDKYADEWIVQESSSTCRDEDTSPKQHSQFSHLGDVYCFN